jgi:hypothetical protein
MPDSPRACSAFLGMLLLALTFSIATTAAASSHSGTAAAGAPSSAHSTASSSRTVHVSGYLRANGTYVSDYYRSPPGLGLTGSSYSTGYQAYPTTPYLAPPSVSTESSTLRHTTGSGIGRSLSSSPTSSRSSASPSLAPSHLDRYEYQVQPELQGQAELRQWILNRNSRLAAAQSQIETPHISALRTWGDIYQAQMRTPAAAAQRLTADRTPAACGGASPRRRSRLAFRTPRIGSSSRESRQRCAGTSSQATPARKG